MPLREIREFVYLVYNSPLSAWHLLGLQEPLRDEWIFTSLNLMFLPSETFSEITPCALAHELPMVGPSLALPPLRGPLQIWPPLLNGTCSPFISSNPSARPAPQIGII